MIAISVTVVLAALQQPPTMGALEGTVRDSASQAPIVAATVRLERLGRRAVTDSTGRFLLDSVAAGEWRVRVTAPGFGAREVDVLTPAGGVVRLSFDLARRAQTLPGVLVRDRTDSLAEGLRARELFERTVEPAVSTMSRREIRAMPTLVEPDVFRALQTLPGLMPINDFDAQLYVRGGSPDQNAVFLDGVRVFGPHHLFGMNGIFNVDAIDQVDFHRGAHSTRFGGGLSSVIDVVQRDGERGSGIDAGFSMIGARAAAAGATEDGRGRWMVALRRTHADAAVGNVMPYSFYDGQTRVTLRPAPSQALTFSAFTSSDRFDLGLEEADRALRSRWRNRLMSARWLVVDGAWTARVSTWGSLYDVEMGNGADAVGTLTQNRVRAGGARVESERVALDSGMLRIGFEYERTNVAIDGGDVPGSYFTGGYARDVGRPAAYVEWVAAVGALRLAPAGRVSRFAGRVTLAEPKLAIRWKISDALSVTAAASRSYQDMSALRDARRLLPGPTFWFVHPTGTPPSRSDALTAELNAWRGSTWNLNAAVYTRAIQDVPRWQPVGQRDLSGVAFDDGRSHGLEVALRRYGARASAWAAYALGHARFTDASTGRDYDAVWDRRHSVSAAGMLRVRSRLELSTQAQVGTGNPFWPFVGHVSAPSMNPLEGMVSTFNQVPVWGDDQVRHPTYARIDVGARMRFDQRWGMIQPYLNLQNVGMRPNVLYYQMRGEPINGSVITDEVNARLRAITVPGALIPTVGVNVRF